MNLEPTAHTMSTVRDTMRSLADRNVEHRPADAGDRRELWQAWLREFTRGKDREPEPRIHS